MDCTYLTSPNINDIIMCTIQTIGLGTEIFALLIIAAFVIFAAAARLEFNMSLGIAWILTYCLMVFAGNGSYMLQFLFAILTLGVALRVLFAIISIFRQ